MALQKTTVPVALVLGVLTLAGFHAAVRAAGVDPNAYFNSLIARRELFRAYSLRPVPGQPIGSPYYENQLQRRKDGGYAPCNSCDMWITYDPAKDIDPHKQDAAKVVIPAFYSRGDFFLSSDIGSNDTVLRITDINSAFLKKTLAIDKELMTVTSLDLPNGSATVTRGTFGTKAVAHKSGSQIELNTNSLPNAVRLPLGTSDGHSYLFTWDAYWTDSYLQSGLTNHKAFNFITNRIWLEPDTNFVGGTGPARLFGFNKNADVAAFQIRLYNTKNGPTVWSAQKSAYAGPNITDIEPLSPQLTPFTIAANRWVRFWVLVEQRANDYDSVSTWIADERNEPVQTHNKLQASVDGNSITEFVLEFNTSTDLYVRGDRRDLVAYVRNFVALQDVSSPVTLLQRPTGIAPGETPARPENVRIVK